MPPTPCLTPSMLLTEKASLVTLHHWPTIIVDTSPFYVRKRPIERHLRTLWKPFNEFRVLFNKPTTDFVSSGLHSPTIWNAMVTIV